jgi:hypothetical protein
MTMPNASSRVPTAAAKRTLGSNVREPFPCFMVPCPKSWPVSLTSYGLKRTHGQHLTKNVPWAMALSVTEINCNGIFETCCNRATLGLRGSDSYARNSRHPTARASRRIRQRLQERPQIIDIPQGRITADRANWARFAGRPLIDIKPLTHRHATRFTFLAPPAQERSANRRYPVLHPQRPMRRLYTRPRTAAVIQPKKRQKRMPSIQILGDRKGRSV